MNTDKYSPIAQRLMRLASEEHISIREMCKILGKHITYVHQLRCTPNEDVLARIVERFPRVSLHWVIFGEGEMYPQKAEERKTQEVEELRAQVLELEEKLAKKDSQIDILLKQLDRI